MQSFLILLLVALSSTEKREIPEVYSGSTHQDTCIENIHVVPAFRNAYDAFITTMFKKAAHRGRYFFTMAPLSVWITLAAIAEGADYYTQKQLFNLLNLPENACTRQKYYQLATTRISSTKYANIIHSRILVIDEGAKINPNWYNLIRHHSLLQVLTAPIKHDPATTSEIVKQIISANQMPDLAGNSVLLNYMDYSGLWTTAFAGAVVERSPFYSHTGRRIGSVDLMKVKKKVRIGYVESENMKVIELPIGINKEYSMIFGLIVDHDANLEPAVRKANNFTAAEVIASLQDSYIAIDVSIPRFMISSEINMKEILEEMGVYHLWTDPIATRYISTPAALPSSYIQRASITLNSDGINPPPFEYPFYPPATDEEKYWGEFVADRPFLFALFDTATYTCIMAASFSQPTYPY